MVRTKWRKKKSKSDADEVEVTPDGRSSIADIDPTPDPYDDKDKAEEEDKEEYKEEADEEEEEDGEEEDLQDGNEEEEDGNKEEEDGDEADQKDEEGTIPESQSMDTEEEEHSEEETELMQPLKMYFPKSEYGKPIKIITRCYIGKVVATLERILKLDKLEWFLEHPQFGHFFHMPKDANHKTMGMWMLLLRKAWTEKRREAWFVVNGVPIRYSLREHALLSGLHCHAYPNNFEKFGNSKFVDKHFKKEKVTYAAVKKKLLAMKPSPDRLKMAVLYFLSSVIIGNAKVGPGAPSVEPIFMRAVTDLEWCKTFPWGRLSFDDTLKEINHMMGSLDGVAKPGWCFPSFIIPLELLPFEAIPDLMKTFREEVRGALCGCPRMCKTKFKASSMRGFPLSEINDALGSTKDIQSIMEPTLDEVSLMLRIMDGPNEDNDYDDVVVDGWKNRLLVQNKKIWFEELYKQDLDGRKDEKEGVSKEKEKANVAEENVGSSEVADLMETMADGFKQFNDKITDIERMVKGLDTRLRYVENLVPPREAVGGEEEVVGGGEEEVPGGEEVVPGGGEEEVVGGEEVVPGGGEEVVATEHAGGGEEVVEKNKKKRKSYSKLTTGAFEKPKTRSRS